VISSHTALERVLFRAVHEYARHAGHLDCVVELATGNAEQESADPAGEQPAG